MRTNLKPALSDREPPPKKLVKTLAQGSGVELSDVQATAAGMGVHMGVLPPPTQQPLEKAALPLGAHLVFGVATSAAFRALG